MWLGLCRRHPPVYSQQGKNLNTGAASVGGLVLFPLVWQIK
jgi:hypothetical protein